MRISEADRFWSHVVKGPDATDCWIWTGAISDDGYGRFYVKYGEVERSVRPHRYVVALVDGADIDDPLVVEHETCDNPICVRYEGLTTDHVMPSTQSANLRRMAHRGRGRRPGPLTYRDRAANREALAARSRALRAAVSHGWDPELIAHALRAYPSPDQLALW